MKKLFSEIPYLQGDRVTLSQLTEADAEPLREMTEDADVYRYLPTFLYEKKYEDKAYVIRRLYDECFPSSLILGVYAEDAFCGLAEIYGYRAPFLKASTGYRLAKKYWGKGIATETLGLLVRYLLLDTDVRIITASTMIENRASANVLQKNGFRHVAHDVPEDWGFDAPVLTDKWICSHAGYRLQYRFRT
ncbi:MAG: GNAT family N-acetyltransferase [Clostridia bacterium]|nr:GNAT family N-acetyltransferase [Clostridia bacterium]